MQKQNYEFDVIINGHPAKEYFKDNKVFIEGRKGQEYSLRVKNNGWKKILVVPTIDGLSVINGKVADYNSPGYIINGYDSMIIDGWRISNDDVAKFYFSDPSDSYASKSGKENNQGIIGLAVFREVDEVVKIINKWFYSEPILPYYTPIKPWYYDDYERYTNYTICDNTPNIKSYNCSLSSCCSSGTSVNQSVGTGWGKQKESKVTSAQFNRESKPDSIFNIYYNTKKELEKLGIDFSNKPRYITPSAFPNQFCEPPKK